MLDILLSTLGTTVPNSIVKDLADHPGITHAVLAAGYFGVGLPAVLQRSGAAVEVVGNSPTSLSLRYLKGCCQALGILRTEQQHYLFMKFEALARVMTRQELEPSQIGRDRRIGGNDRFPGRKLRSETRLESLPGP